jgi:curli production assembly/transport component CsgF
MLSIKKSLISAVLVNAVCFPVSASANELVFQFTNPNFGGNPLNGSFLAAVAEAQRSATANDADVAGGVGAGGGTGTGGIGGPTIIVPITQGSAGAPNVSGGTDGVDQVSN